MRFENFMNSLCVYEYIWKLVDGVIQLRNDTGIYQIVLFMNNKRLWKQAYAIFKNVHVVYMATTAIQHLFVWSDLNCFGLVGVMEEVPWVLFYLFKRITKQNSTLHATIISVQFRNKRGLWLSNATTL